MDPVLLLVAVEVGGIVLYTAVPVVTVCVKELEPDAVTGDPDEPDWTAFERERVGDLNKGTAIYYTIY